MIANIHDAPEYVAPLSQHTTEHTGRSLAQPAGADPRHARSVPSLERRGRGTDRAEASPPLGIETPVFHAFHKTSHRRDATECVASCRNVLRCTLR